MWVDCMPGEDFVIDGADEDTVERWESVGLVLLPGRRVESVG